MGDCEKKTITDCGNEINKPFEMRKTQKMGWLAE